MIENIRVVGHRGVRKIEVENSRQGLKDAVDFDVDAVEFDVRMTTDGILVVCHNRNLKKIYGMDRNIDEIPYEKVKNLVSKNGETIPTLKEILGLNLGKPLMLDVKNRGSAKLIYEQMKSSGQPWVVITFLPEEAKAFKKLNPNIKVSLASFRHPRVIEFAKKMGADAITIPLYLLNPITYLQAKKAGLSVVVYQNYVPWLLTNRFLVKLLDRLYPRLIFVTDRPDKIVPVIKKLRQVR